MSEKKKKIDKFFLVITLISFLTLIIMPKYGFDVVSGIMLGFIGTSFIFMLGIRRLESETFKRVYFNLFKNIVVYALIMVIAMQISLASFIVCIITITTYRIMLINSLRKWKEE